LDNDPANGWEAVARQLIERRDQSHIGVDVVRTWAGTLNRGASILDLGCGSGVPISQALMDDGFIVTGIDASPTLVAAFRRRFPGADIACEQAETSQFLGRTYDAAIAIGLLFVLGEAAQKTLISKVGSALKVGGRFLFTAPSQSCTWNDLMTGRQSRSLGAPAYLAILSQSGLALSGEYTDEGQNHYYSAIRQ
jgi:2-polyprenyl-3-methyl-5-hydroxy-6-metoxy-1,4-benzoquinol methylase